MVRIYTPKTTMASYSDRQLRDAIAPVKEGRSMEGAVKDYGIPKRTLMRHCWGKVAQPGVSVLGGKRQVFTDKLENEIMKERCMVCLLRLAYSVADRMGLANPFNKATGMAGRDWLSRATQTENC